MIVNWSGLYHHLPLRMTTQYSDEYEPGDGDVTDRWHSPMSRHYAEAYYQCDVRQTAKTFILKGHRLFPKFQLVVPQNTPSTRDGVIVTLFGHGIIQSSTVHLGFIWSQCQLCFLSL